MRPTDPGGASGIRPGVRLGVDVGDVRVGVAASDPHALLAMPVETVPGGSGAVSRVVALVEEYAAIEVVVGLPRHLSGALGSAADKASAFAEQLRDALAGLRDGVSVRVVDERLTTVSAERVLREQGRKGRARRQVVDQAAAVVILQHALDTERSTGRPPGQEVGRPRE